jgi:hypothetical protein
MVVMQMPQEQPIHWDSNRRSTNFTFILAMVVTLFGLFSLVTGSDNGVVLLLGLAAAAYSWLTTPKHFLIFSGTLEIAYGTPRRKVIPFEQVSHVEFISLPTIGDRLRVRLVNGRSLMVQAKDSETFHDRLEEALNNFHGGRGAGSIEGESSSTGDET